MVNVTIARGSMKLETEVKCLEREVITLRMAIEEAILRGQRSVAILDDVPESDVAGNEDSAFTCVNADPGIVGQVDDF